MSQIQRGYNYNTTSNKIVTADNLNNLVGNSILLPGAVGEQNLVSNPELAAEDNFLIKQNTTGQLGRTTLFDVLNTGTSITTNQILSSVGQDLYISTPTTETLHLGSSGTNIRLHSSLETYDPIFYRELVSEYPNFEVSNTTNFSIPNYNGEPGVAGFSPNIGGLWFDNSLNTYKYLDASNNVQEIASKDYVANSSPLHGLKLSAMGRFDKDGIPVGTKNFNVVCLRISSGKYELTFNTPMADDKYFVMATLSDPWTESNSVQSISEYGSSRHNDTVTLWVKNKHWSDSGGFYDSGFTVMIYEL